MQSPGPSPSRTLAIPHPSDAHQAVLDRHIDRIFLSRVGIRFLVKHYVASREPVDGFMGIIQKECCPAELCEATATSIAADCRERWGAAPPIEVHANDRSQVRVRVRVRVRAGVRARVT